MDADYVRGSNFEINFSDPLNTSALILGALLIDDSPKNCKLFTEPERGGHAILFPDLANDLNYIEPNDRLSYVKEQLKGYRKSKV